MADITQLNSYLSRQRLKTPTDRRIKAKHTLCFFDLVVFSRQTACNRFSGPMEVQRYIHHFCRKEVSKYDVNALSTYV